MKNNIKEIIERKGLKITFIIRKIGISRSSFYEIMNGNCVPSLLNARAISDVLNEDLEEVFPNDKFQGNTL